MLFKILSQRHVLIFRHWQGCVLGIETTLPFRQDWDLNFWLLCGLDDLNGDFSLELEGCKIFVAFGLRFGLHG